MSQGQGSNFLRFFHGLNYTFRFLKCKQAKGNILFGMVPFTNGMVLLLIVVYDSLDTSRGTNPTFNLSLLKRYAQIYLKAKV